MNETDRAAAVALWITAGLIGLFAVGLIAQPAELQTGHAVAQPPAAPYATELRASSGGFKLGAAIAMAVLTWQCRYREGLMLAVAVLACSAASRALGGVLGDSTPLHWIVTAAEAFGAVSCGWHWRRTSLAALDSPKSALGSPKSGTPPKLG